MNSNIDLFDDRVVIPDLFGNLAVKKDSKNQYFSAPDIDINQYDKIILAESLGKDSIACLLHLIDIGADISKVELWHHSIDGHEGSQLMDWLFMEDYARKFADAFDLPLYFSWLDGGFEMEMLKHNSFSRPHKIETPDGLLTLQRDKKRGKPGTRLRFPQQSVSLSTRYCSSVLKIDISRRALNNQTRFDNQRVLFITGERRSESPNRARYNQLESHACDRRHGRKARLVDAWRPVLEWSEEQVWDALKRHRIVAPIPYRLGWNRSSCFNCIYNSPKIWATIKRHFPDRSKVISDYEDQFGVTISRKLLNVSDICKGVEPLEILDTEALEQSYRETYDLPIFVAEGDPWLLPAGAFSNERCGSD